MRLISGHLVPFRLPLRRPWVSGAGRLSCREGLLLRLEADNGLSGHGECTPLPAAGTEDGATALKALQGWLQGCRGTAPEDWLERLKPVGFDTPAARCALETALLDLLSQQAGQPLSQWLNPGCTRRVKVNATLGALDRGAIARTARAVGEGYGVLKIKVGLLPPERELAHLHRLADALPEGVRMRLDANRAWTEPVAARYLAALSALPVEAVEEPLSQPGMDGLRRLQALVSFPLAVDESLRELERERFFADAPVKRIVVKPMAAGGVLAGLALAQAAAWAGLECVVTTTVDGACGVLAALHLAAAVSNDLSHGLATSAWLERDIGEVPQPQAGTLAPPRLPGLGFSPALVCCRRR